MKRIAVLLFLALLACMAGAYALFSSQQSASADPALITLDSVNIGKIDSPPQGLVCSMPYSAEEVAHSASGWGTRDEPACTGGGWGGGSSDGTARAAWHRYEYDAAGNVVDGTNSPEGTVTLTSSGYQLGTLVVEALDGAGATHESNSFQVRVNGTLVYTYHATPGGAEIWVVHSIDLVNPANSTRSPAVSGSSFEAGTGIDPCTSTLVVEIKNIGDAWAMWSTYGQLGISNVKLNSTDPATMCEADVAITSQSFVNPPAQIDLSATVPVTMRKVLHNNGPYSAEPVTVTITNPAVIIDNCEINPPPAVQVVLPFSVDVPVDETFTIHCSKRSSHSLNVTNHVTGPKDPQIVDPDLTNNSATTTLAVDVIAHADAKIISQSVVGLPPNIPVSEDVPVTIEKVLHNNGPDGPVTVELGTVLDRVNIGYNGAATPCNAALSADEAAHAATGWGPSVEPACTHGNYGGGSDDGNSRLLWHWNEAEGGSDAERAASVTLNADGLKPGILRLNVLDGMAGIPIPDDSFEVRVNGTLVYTYNGSNPVTQEMWVVHSIDLFNPAASSRTPVIAGSTIVPGSPIAPASTLVVEIKSTGNKWTYFNPYGQLAVSWVELLAGNPSVVELPRSVDVAVDEPLVIHCWEPSTHTFTITNKILGIEDEHVVDPDLTNNSATTNVTVDCIGTADVKVESVSVPAFFPADVSITYQVPISAVVHNNGPFGPVWAHNRLTFNFDSQACTLYLQFEQYPPIPIQPGQVIDGPSRPLEVSTDVTASAMLIGHCSQPGLFLSSGSAEIVIDSPHVVDPDPTNNEGGEEREVTVVANADVKIESQQFVDPPTSIDVNASVPVTLEKVLHNNGPWGPVDIELGAVIDSVNIGYDGAADPCNAPYSAAEVAHSADGWAAEVVPACRGAYGGGSDDGNSRVAWHLNELPSGSDRQASVTLTNPGFQLGTLRMSVLDGQAGSNSFEVRVNGTLVYTYHSDPSTAEFWVVHSIDLVNPANSSFDVGNGSFIAGTGIGAFTANLVVEVTVLGDQWPSFDPYGQLAVSWFELLAGSPIQVTLPVSDNVIVDEPLVIHCAEPSTHVFPFVNKILKVEGEYVVDPDLGNNSMPGQITVDCIAKADVQIASQALVSPPSQIDVGASVVVTLHKHLHNIGPYGPVQVSISPSAVAPADCTATPATGNPASANLPVSADVVVDEVWTIQCTKASTHTFTFNNAIALTSPPHVTDPVTGNNSKATPLTVNAIGHPDPQVVSVAVNGPATIDASANVNITVNTTLKNSVYGPVAVNLAYSANVPGDCTATAAATGQVMLPVGQLVDAHTWTIHCSQPSDHTFSFTTTITGIKDAHVVETNPNNNTGSGSYAVKVWAYSDLKVAAQYFENPPTEIPVSQNVTVTLDKVIHNNGFYGPVDATTTTTVTVPAGCTISPNPHTQLFVAVPVSVDVLHHEPFVIHCTVLGPHTFVFDDVVAVTSVHVKDLVSDNNGEVTELLITAVGTADIKILSASFVDPPTKIVLGQPVDVTLRKVIHNNGPKGPVDIAIVSNPIPPTGCTIVPKAVPTSLTAVPVSVDQVVNEVWTISCTVDGLKTFVLNNSIAVSTPHIADPKLLNNSVRKLLTVRDPSYPYWGDDICDGKDNDGDTVIDEGWDLVGSAAADCLDPALDTDRDGLTNDVDLDDDGDGWSDAREGFLRTDPLSACPVQSRVHDAWPPDINADRTINALDISPFRGPLLGAYDRRFDLTNDGRVNALDLSQYRSYLGMSCTP